MEATLTSQEMAPNEQRAVYNLPEDEKASKGRFLNPISSKITLRWKRKREKENRGEIRKRKIRRRKKAMVAPLVFIIAR